MTFEQALQQCHENGWALNGMCRIGPVGRRQWCASLESLDDYSRVVRPPGTAYTHVVGFRENGFDTPAQAILAALDFAIAHPPMNHVELRLAAAIDNLTRTVRDARI